MSFGHSRSHRGSERRARRPLRKVRLDGAGTAYLRRLSKVPKRVNRLQKSFPPSISSMKQAQMARVVNKPDVTRAAQWREPS
jgi:hypothetical protein